MHLNSKLIFERHAMPHLLSNMAVLEIGPDAIPSTYQQIAAGHYSSWDTVDIFPRDGLSHVASSENSFPIEDESYDVVLSGQVIEHVRKPWIWMRELLRICKPNGLIITIAPVSWPYHEAPIDCWRIYPAGMAALFDDLEVDLLVNEYASLEDCPSSGAFVIPGRSIGSQWRKQKWAASLLNRFGVPHERAFDLVCVARKRVSACIT